MSANIEVRYRFKTDPWERPDFKEIIPEHELAGFLEELAGHDGEVIGKREVGWREMLDRHENSHQL